MKSLPRLFEIKVPDMNVRQRPLVLAMGGSGLTDPESDKPTLNSGRRWSNPELLVVMKKNHYVQRPLAWALEIFETYFAQLALEGANWRRFGPAIVPARHMS
jgi:hypothetical protein